MFTATLTQHDKEKTMSPAMSALQSVGITNAILILGVLFAVAAGVIGLFWHYILPGAIIIGVLCLFLPPSSGDVTAKFDKTEQVTTTVKEEVFDERQAYMKDCMEVAEYPMAKCAALWEHREESEPVVTKTKVDKVDTSELQLLDVDNREYKARRAAALQKPNAVVGHVTFR
jgi:hypothetical protein